MKVLKVKSSIRLDLFQKLFPALEIHIWGGLGSQLFGLLAVEEVKNLSPLRKIKIVFHSSGVSHRRPDVIELIPKGMEISVLDDFMENENQIDMHRGTDFKRGLISSIFKNITRRSKLVVSLDKVGGKPKFWTIQVRGHYRMMHVNFKSLDSIYRRIKDEKLRISDLPAQETNAIHFRIGDLVGLKGIVNPNDLLQVAEKVQKQNQLPFSILSDSRLEASHYLSSLKINPIHDFLSAWDTIRLGHESSVFIGTLSKISYWIVMLRVLSFPEKSNFLPHSAALEMRQYFKFYGIEANIEPYDFTLVEM